jgi:hypothetical protein
MPINEQNRELRVGGKPFFPIMMFAVDPHRIDGAAASGANTLAEPVSHRWPKLLADRGHGRGSG